MPCTPLWRMFTGHATIKGWDLTCAKLEQRLTARRTRAAAVLGLAAGSGTSAVRSHHAHEGPVQAGQTVFHGVKTRLMQGANRYPAHRFERLLTKNRRLQA